MKIQWKKLLVVSLAVALLGVNIKSLAEEAAESRRLSILTISGEEAFVARSAGNEMKAVAGMPIAQGNKVRTGAKTNLYVQADNSKIIKLENNTEAEVTQASSKKLKITLKSGEMFFNVDKPLEEGEELNFDAAQTSMSIRGTSGIIRFEEDKLTFYLIEGHVEWNIGDQVLTVQAGQKVILKRVFNDQLPTAETSDFYLFELIEPFDWKDLNSTELETVLQQQNWVDLSAIGLGTQEALEEASAALGKNIELFSLTSSQKIIKVGKVTSKKSRSKSSSSSSRTEGTPEETTKREPTSLASPSDARPSIEETTKAEPSTSEMETTPEDTQPEETTKPTFSTEKPTESASGEEKPTKPTSSTEKPTEPSSSEEKPTESTSSTEESTEPTSSSTEKPTEPTSSTEESTEPTSSSTEKPTEPISSTEESTEPTSSSTEKPTKPTSSTEESTSNTEKPTKPSSSEEKPTESSSSTEESTEPESTEESLYWLYYGDDIDNVTGKEVIEGETPANEETTSYTDENAHVIKGYLRPLYIAYYDNDNDIDAAEKRKLDEVKESIDESETPSFQKVGENTVWGYSRPAYYWIYYDNESNTAFQKAVLITDSEQRKEERIESYNLGGRTIQGYRRYLDNNVLIATP